MPAREERHLDCAASQGLEDVAGIHNDELEHMATCGAAKPKSPEMKRVSHLPRDSDDDRDADAHAQTDTAAGVRYARREQDERGMVARPGRPRRRRPDADFGRGTAGQDDPCRPDAKPGGGAACCGASEEEARGAVKTQDEPGRRGVDDECLRAAVGDTEDSASGTDDRHVRGRRRQRKRRPTRSRARGGGREHREYDRRGADDHRPITVNVSVAV
jgi:hypothetical protein